MQTETIKSLLEKLRTCPPTEVDSVKRAILREFDRAEIYAYEEGYTDGKLECDSTYQKN